MPSLRCHASVFIFLFTTAINFCTAQTNKDLTDTISPAVEVIAPESAVKDTIAAQFPGGLSAWTKYLAQNLHYPKTAMDNKAKGKIIVKMRIDEVGDIVEAIALNNPGYGLAEEAVRVVKSGPKWIPANAHGRAIASYRTQPITFSTTSRTNMVSPFYFFQKLVIQTKKEFKGQKIAYVASTEDFSGVDVVTADMRSYFLPRNEAMQQLGIFVNESGIVAPEDARTVYLDNNGKPTDNYQNLKFVGGNRQFRFFSLFKKGTHTIDSEKSPILLLNGKEASNTDIEALKPYSVRGCNLAFIQEGPAQAAFGSRGKNGVLFISTKMPIPDNFLYLLNGKESTNEEIAALAPGTTDTMRTLFGKSQAEKYGRSDKMGVVLCKTKPTNDKDIYDQVFSQSLIPATFPGGDEGWKKYMVKNLHYPDSAKNNNFEATVRVRIILNPEGSVTKAYAMNNPGSGLAEEAVRLLTQGPKWIPATYNGRNVSYTLVQVVAFKLDASHYY